MSGTICSNFTAAPLGSDMEAPIVITLPGLPRGKGRPRFTVRGRHAVAYTDAKTASFEGALRQTAAIAMAGRAPLSGALALVMSAVFPIPESWSKAKKRDAAAGLLRPTGKPDCDNILKQIDGLNGIIFRDDAQIVEATVTKQYGDQPRLTIEVRPSVVVAA